MDNKNEKRPVVLVLLDGWGYREEKKDNAIASANKPFYDSLLSKYPHSLLKASGEAVGLPEGQIGDSDDGHLTIGAGRPIDSYLLRINKAIRSGEFGTSPSFAALFDHVKKNGSTLHIMGLVSPGGVHSHEEHLFAFLMACKENKIPRVAIHVFTDGRDRPPKSASKDIIKLENLLAELKENYFIASVSGRYYAMDRDSNWDRIERARLAIFDAKANICDTKVSRYLDEQYQKGETDELLPPAICKTDEGHGCALKQNDGIFFINFRPDRARELSSIILEKRASMNLYFLTMTRYKEDFDCPIVFPSNRPLITLGSEISKANMSQVHMAETEKFAHATYFLDGGREKPYDGETDILIQSRKDIKTHDQAPEMKAIEITDKARESISSKPDFIFINLANADMVGHTGNVPAIIKAVETIDMCLEKIYHAVQNANGIMLITADHGNAETNIDPITHERHTDHTTNPVPFIIVSNEYKVRDGALYDIAPTVLQLLNISVPEEMTGKSLLS